MSTFLQQQKRKSVVFLLTFILPCCSSVSVLFLIYTIWPEEASGRPNQAPNFSRHLKQTFWSLLLALHLQIFPLLPSVLAPAPLSAARVNEHLLFFSGICCLFHLLYLFKSYMEEGDGLNPDLWYTAFISRDLLWNVINYTHIRETVYLGVTFHFIPVCILSADQLRLLSDDWCKARLKKTKKTKTKPLCLHSS